MKKNLFMLAGATALLAACGSPAVETDGAEPGDAPAIETASEESVAPEAVEGDESGEAKDSAADGESGGSSVAETIGSAESDLQEAEAKLDVAAKIAAETEAMIEQLKAQKDDE